MMATSPDRKEGTERGALLHAPHPAPSIWPCRSIDAQRFALSISVCVASNFSKGRVRMDTHPAGYYLLPGVW
jgi:hypothetical protein